MTTYVAQDNLEVLHRTVVSGHRVHTQVDDDDDQLHFGRNLPRFLALLCGMSYSTTGKHSREFRPQTSCWMLSSSRSPQHLVDCSSIKA